MNMKAKAIVLILFMSLLLGSCGGVSEEPSDGSGYFSDFLDAIDIELAKTVIKNVSNFGDDPVMGMRSAGSPAETDTANYLEDVMKDIGLENVTLEEITVDGWTFEGANLTFTNTLGETQKIDLAGYQTTIQSYNEECELVYINRGTEEDYEGINVNDKLVLIDIDQNEDWWINFPAYQAKVKGAKAVIAMSEYEIEASDRVGVQDICGPADAPALAISQEDSEALKEAIAASGGGTIKVVLNADSQVTKDATSHNVWGEIPGKIDETIFVFAHMDGYFHSQYDDAQGLGVSLAIAKAIIDIGYEPEKTIRFCFHGAEEWGASGNEYDWSIGAYEEIATNHPEWVDGAFAIVNNDGGYVVEGETYMGTRSAVELMSFIKESIGELNSNSDYEWSYKKTSTYTEDFYWSRLGVPAIVAGSGEGEIYNNTGYHSNYDSWEYQPLDETGLKESIKTFGKLVLDLDNCFVRPMDFTARLKDFEESLNDPKDFETLFSDAYEAASAIEEKMASVEASGNQEAALELNKHTQEIYIAFQNALLGLDFESEATIKHEVYQSNIEALENAIEKLNNGEIQEAFDEYIVDVDWAWYYMNFDFETCRYLENQLFENRDDTWGEGLVLYRPCDIGEVVKALGSKYDTVNADVSQEIAKLEELLSIEQQRLEQVLGDEKKGIELVINLMNQYAK